MCERCTHQPAQAQALLDGGEEAALQALIAHDIDEKSHGEQATALEKLIRLQRDLLRLRLQAARARVDALIERLPANQGE